MYLKLYAEKQEVHPTVTTSTFRCIIIVNQSQHISFSVNVQIPSYLLTNPQIGSDDSLQDWPAENFEVKYCLKQILVQN